MNKAFLFDMDGVLVDSEHSWVGEDYDFLTNIFGKEIAEKIGSTTGVSVKTIYEKAVGFGAQIDETFYVAEYDKRAASLYARAPLIEGTDTLAEYLLANGFRLGLVSASRQKWIESVITRLPFYKRFEVVISINDTPGLRSKPAPDGYAEALHRMNIEPQNAIVLEDANMGIASGKAAGAYVIGYNGHLIPGYKQTGADAYANTMADVIKLVESFDGN